MQVSKLPKLPLPSGAQALIKWAELRGYRPVSFTDTAVANLFNLRIREPGKKSKMNKYCWARWGQLKPANQTDTHSHRAVKHILLHTKLGWNRKS